ncbi:MAG: DUF3592 domain-containing protein [Chloroflexota bacterium]|nr:DUF3592 domain-containing protein [Ardenticatenaceae bacterium]
MKVAGKGCGCIGTTIFLGIFVVVGIGISYWGWHILQNARVSLSWPTTDGQITSSYVREDRDEDGTSYFGDVTYTYAVNDVRYTSDMVNFGQYGGSRNHAQEIVDKYPEGNGVTVSYDPNDPETAVLEPGVTGGSYLVLGLGIIFVVFPLLMAPFMLIGTLRR